MSKYTNSKLIKHTKSKAKIYRRRAVKIASLILALAVSLWFLQTFVLCNAGHNTERVRGFYLEDENSLDVVFVGSSEVYCCYSPALAYKECGFTSYPYATESNTVLNFKAIYEEIMRTQNPKLIVFEINGAIYGDENIGRDASLRRVVDNMPFNENREELINSVATSDQLEYYIPFIKYHGSWDNLPNTWSWSLAVIRDQLRGYNLLKGVKNKTEIFRPKTRVYTASQMSSRMPLFSKSDKGLHDFLNYLEEKNVDKDKILFVRVPHVNTDENRSRYLRGNTVGDVVKSYGYDFVSFEVEDPEIGTDVHHDFYNLEHMNIYGQQKFSKYFSHYLQKRYDLSPTKLTAKQKEIWDKTVPYYDAYVKYNLQMLKEGKAKEIGEDFLSMRQIGKIMKENQ